MGRWIFLTFYVNLDGRKGENSQSRIFQKKSHFREKAQKFLQNKVFWLLPKLSSIDLFFYPKNIILQSMIYPKIMILQKLHAWEKCCSSIIGKMVSTKQVAVFFDH